MVVACDRRYEPIWYVHQTVEDMMGDNFKNGWLRLDQLIDPVLPETVFQLPGLEELLISHLRYKTLPKGVEKLPGLKRLTMRFNRMSKLSSRFAKLSSLENLGLAHNNFKTVPAVLGKLPHLKVLELASNPLGDWTSAPGDFRALRALWIYDCGFSAFPKDLLHLDLLEELHIGRISDTKRFTSIPAEIAEMKGLRHLDVSAQLIEALPNTMATMALEKLNLSYTQLQVFPSAQLNAATLQSINISNCKKIHRLPDDIGDFIHLQHLNIGGTSIRTLPATIAQLQNLQMLDISGLRWEDASGTLEILLRLPALKELTCYRQPQSFIDALRRQLQFTLVRD
jgi:Leucine-rich repeat (LRR) protein